MHVSMTFFWILKLKKKKKTVYLQWIGRFEQDTVASTGSCPSMKEGKYSGVRLVTLNKIVLHIYDILYHVTFNHLRYLFVGIRSICIRNLGGSVLESLQYRAISYGILLLNRLILGGLN